MWLEARLKRLDCFAPKEKMPTESMAAESWYPTVIDLMLNDRMEFLQACAYSGVTMDPQTASMHKRRKSWREMFARASQKFYEARGDPETVTKLRLVGEMLEDARGLRTIGKLKEAADITAVACKIHGYSSPDTVNNFWDTLSGADIARAREELAVRRAAPPTKPN